MKHDGTENEIRKKLNTLFILKKEQDKIINNTYDESLFKEYLLNRTEYNKKELDEIIYTKRIE